MLNPSQLKASLHLSGPLLLLACSGAGKTKTITERYKNLVKSGVAESNILMITFTNKAANEMKHRIMQSEPSYSCPNVSTFHSMAVRVLRRYAEELSFSSKFSIFDDHEQKKLIKQLMKDTPSLKPSIKADKIKTIIGNNKNNGVFSARDYVIEEADQTQIREICIAYNNRLQKANAFDFDDLLLFFLKLLEQHPKALISLQSKFKYIIIDEYQDTNQVQYRMALKLAEKARNLCVTGDANQSIYSFRAADYRIILSFLKDFPNATRIDLNENYRSTKEIVECANSLIKNNTQRFDNESHSIRGSNTQPVSYENYSSSFEEAQMISFIISQETKEGKKFKDFTVLCRTNAQSMPLENMFMTNRIPYTMVSGFSFFDRKEVKDMLSYLKFLYNTDDFNAYLRICNVPKRGLGETTSVRFTTTCANNNLKFFNYVVDNPDLTDYRSIGLTKTAFEKNLEFFNKLKLIDASLPVGDIMDHVMEHLGFKDMLKEQEAFILEKDGLVKDKMLFIEQLKEMSVNIAKELGRNTLEGFLSYTSLFSDKDNVDEDDKVKIMTIHASKGLEFKNVFIPGVNENILPHSRSQHSEGIEEERRLFYVAITRAQDQVYISSTNTMSVFGKETESKPSRFIQELNIE